MDAMIDKLMNFGALGIMLAMLVYGLTKVAAWLAPKVEEFLKSTAACTEATSKSVEAIKETMSSMDARDEKREKEGNERWAMHQANQEVLKEIKADTAHLVQRGCGGQQQKQN